MCCVRSRSAAVLRSASVCGDVRRQMGGPEANGGLQKGKAIN
jgi:hypothetical protein